MNSLKTEKQTYRILIAEDDFEQFNLLKEIILSEFPDADIVHALNGMRAIEILRKHIVHVVVSDYSMPEMNGLELLVLLRAANITSPFVLITGNINAEIVKSAWRAGATAMLDKPYELENVKNVILSAIKSSSYNSIRAYGSTLSERLIQVELHLPERVVNHAIIECDRQGISLSEHVASLLKKDANRTQA